MPLTPALNATVRITSYDNAGNSVAKAFSSVSELRYDFSKGVVSVNDATGQFYFPLLPTSTLTHTVVSGTPNTHVVVIS